MNEPLVSLERDYASLDLDPHWIDENRESARRRLIDSLPPRYRDAEPTDPHVAEWVRFVVSAAVETRNAVMVAVTQGPSLLLLGPTGTGKALADFTEIATPVGPRPIGGLQVGDAVFGGDGEPCKVVGAYPQGVRDLWKVTLRDGRSVTCDDEHLWQITTRSDRHLGIPPKVMSLREIRETGLTYADGTARWFIPISGTVEFARSELPVDPYTLGALIGDGGLTGNTPAFTTADPEITRQLRLPEGVELHERPRQRNSKALTYLLAGRRPQPNQLTVQLRSLGLMGTRSSNKFIPSLYLLADQESRVDLLAGLADTDGYIKGTSVAISTSSPDLARDVCVLAWSLGGMASARQKQTTHLPSWTIHLALPERLGCPSRLSRKRDAWTARRDGRGGTIAITSVERSIAGPATCIAVDSPDSTYLTAEYVRTHNTYQAWGAIRALAASGLSVSWTVTTAADMYARLRPRHRVDSEEEFERYQKTRVLVLDDLGAAKGSEFTEEINYRLINYRYERALPTLITSNIPPRELGSALGERVSSRLTEMAHRVVLKGDDRRRHSQPSWLELTDPDREAS